MPQGHGHVRPRSDGAKARCGGPALCPVCALEAQGARITPELEQLAIENSRLKAQLTALLEERGDYVTALEQIRSSMPATRKYAEQYFHCMNLAKEALNKHADKRIVRQGG